MQIVVEKELDIQILQHMASKSEESFIGCVGMKALKCARKCGTAERSGLRRMLVICDRRRTWTTRGVGAPPSVGRESRTTLKWLVDQR